MNRRKKRSDGLREGRRGHICTIRNKEFQVILQVNA